MMELRHSDRSDITEGGVRLGVGDMVRIREMY